MADSIYYAEPAGIDIDAEYSDFQEDADDDADRMSYTSGASLASSVTRYRYENGRRYHAYREGTYYAPNDAQGQSSEAIVHHLWLLTLHDKLFLTPLEDPKRILDIGAGTGLWAVDIADHFPNAEVTATDLSPILYTTAPPNLTYEIDDANLCWTYPLDHFDFIHIRGLTGCIKSWPHTYHQAYAHLTPGGYLEHLEFSVTTSADPSSPNPSDQLFTQFSTSVHAAGAKAGMTFSIITEMASLMRSTGFVDVREEKFVWPIGPWPKDPHLKDLGRWGERNWSEGVEGWVLALYTRLLGWSYEEVRAFVEQLRKVIRNRKNRFWHEVRCVYGRKPLEGEVPEGEGKGVGEKCGGEEVEAVEGVRKAGDKGNDILG